MCVMIKIYFGIGLKLALWFIIVYFLSYHSSSLTGVGSESGAASPYTPSVVKTEKQTNLMFDVTGI